MTTLRAIAEAEPRAATYLTQALMGSRRTQALLLVSPHEGRAEQVADAFVQALLCGARSGRDGCGACPACRKVVGGNHVNVVAPDVGARGLSIGGVRALQHDLGMTGRDGALKVAKVRGVSRMAAAAQNALLKTLEEPPGEVCFVLTGNRVQTVLPTVRSRVQLVRLHGVAEHIATDVLRAHGIADGAAALAAMAYGDDTEAAKGLIDANILGLLERLEGLWVGGDDAQAITKLSQDFGHDQRAADAALFVLEALLRDALAVHAGVAEVVLRLGPLAKRLLQCSHPAQIVAAIDALLAHRMLGAAPINRSLALEAIFHLLLQKTP